MSVALDIYLFSFTMLFATLLSVATGVGGCEWPIYDRAVCIDVAF